MQQMKKPQGFATPNKLFKPKESEIRKQHRELTESQNQSDEQSGDQALEDEQGNAICCCGHPACRIGPFVPDNRPKGNW